MQLNDKDPLAVSVEEIGVEQVWEEDEYSEVQVDMDRHGVTVEDEVGVWPMVNTLRHDIEKARAYRVLPLYLFFLATITSIPWMSRLSNERYNELYHLEKANEQEFLNDKFRDTYDIPTFWSWYKDITVQIFAPRPSTGRLSSVSNFPLGYVLLRQFRVGTKPCAMPSIIKGTMHVEFPDLCYGEWMPDRRDDTPYGPPDNPWTASSELDVLSISTMFHSYSNPEEAYTIIFPLTMTEPDAIANVSYLEAHKWVDAATRVVIIDIVTFNPAIDAFALNHYYVEFFATGSVVSGLKAYPFEILHFDTHSSRYIFVADVIMVLLTLQLAVGCCVTIYRRRQMRYGTWAGLYDVYDVMFIVILVHGSYYRMLLWRDGPDMYEGPPPTDDKEMFVRLFNYGFRYERANTYVGIAVVFAWIRLFRFLQYHSRLGVLSETLSKAKADLFAMFIILIIVLVGYGIGGSALYGVDHNNFSSWWIAMAYLLRLLISAEVDQYYDELKAIHPNWTGFYMATFMIITWVILLNMVLAVITGAFVSVQENNKSSDDGWSVKSLKKDFKNYFTRFPPISGSSSGYCDVRLFLVLHLLEVAEKKKEEESLHRRMMFITLREWFDASAPVITTQLALKMFMRGKARTRTPEKSRNIARSVNGLAMKMDKVQATVFRMGQKVDKQNNQSFMNDNVSHAVLALAATSSIGTQTDTLSQPPLGPQRRRETAQKERRRHASLPGDELHRSTASTRLSKSNESDEDGTPLLAQARRKKTKRKGSHPVNSLGCKSLGCVNIVDNMGDAYCYDHLCPNCQGVKPTKHQPLCARCEISPGSGVRLPETRRSYAPRRFSQDSQGFPSTRPAPQSLSPHSFSPNTSFSDPLYQGSNPLIPYSYANGQ